MLSRQYIRRQLERLRGASKDHTDGVIPKELIGRYLPSRPVILEAGAHIGVDTEEMLNTWRDSTIHAFEPIPELFSKLESRVAGNSRAHLYKLGLGDKPGRSKIFVSSGASDASSSLLKPKRHLEVNPAVKFEKQIDIKVVTIETWAKEYGVPKIDFMWLDLQGMELQVLKNAGGLLDTIKVILAEVSLIETYESAPLADELKEFLLARGFKVLVEEMPYPDMGDILFVRKRH